MTQSMIAMTSLAMPITVGSKTGLAMECQETTCKGDLMWGYQWWWIWGGYGVGFSHEACLGLKLGIGEVELLGVTAGRGWWRWQYCLE